MTTHLTDSLAASLGPNYTIERELDGGGMSRLFLATDRTLERRVVVKVLAPELVSQESTARFKREIAWTIKLQHPHILPVLSSGSFGDCLYYITPYIAGESLRARLKRERKLPLDDVLKILRDVSDSLAFAHAEGVIHRDVKPGNILLAGGHAILADFGIARAIETQTNALTASGLMPGTPAYMSPELPTDASADLFALAVVAYEMLCGELPTKEVTVAGIFACRRAVRDDTRGALLAIADLVVRTMSKRAPHGIDASLFLSRVEHALARRQSNTRFLAIAAGVVAVALAAGGWAFLRTPVGDLNVNGYVIIPADSHTSTLAVADEVQRYLREWGGVSAEQGQRAPGLVPDRRRARKTAIDARARNVLTLSTRAIGDSLDVQAQALDVVENRVIRQTETHLARTQADPAGVMALRRFANAAIRDGEEIPWKTATDKVKPSLDAWRAYDRGRAALEQWSLPAAISAFQDAIKREPSFTLAHLWLAQTLQLTDTSRGDEARVAAMRALRSPGDLSPRDSLLATGLQALADARYPDARGSFQTLVERDSTFLPAWLDLGESLARDTRVIPDARTLTGWVFRGSFEGAARAYRRAALAADPNMGPLFRGWLFGRLSNVLYATPNHVRRGGLTNEDPMGMGAIPYLDADSEAFAPHPMEDFPIRKGDPPQEGVRKLVSRSRQQLRAAAEEWVRLAPGDATAFDSLAAWSEVADGKAFVGGRLLSTLELLRTARRLSRDTTEQLLLSVAEVRALLKERRFAEAANEADSLLRHGAVKRNRDVLGIVGLSALLGHAKETAQLLPSAGGDRRITVTKGRAWSLSRPIDEAASALIAYSVFGAFEDSVHVLRRRTCDLIGDYWPESAVADAVSSVLVAGTLGYGDLTPTNLTECSTPPDELVKAVLLFIGGDRIGATRQLDHLKEIDRGKEPGKGIRTSFRIARLRLALGDTASAQRELDEIIRTLPMHDPAYFMNDITHVVPLVRSFALRAQLARARGDREHAAEDAKAVVTLWRGADGELQPLVTSMKAMLSARP